MQCLEKIVPKATSVLSELRSKHQYAGIRYMALEGNALRANVGHHASSSRDREGSQEQDAEEPTASADEEEIAISL